MAAPSIAARLQQIRQSDMSDEDRQRLASEGKALPDGQLPTPSKRHLRAAIHALPYYKGDKQKAKEYIHRRASALNAKYLLPKAWLQADGALAQEAVEPRCPTCNEPLYGVKGEDPAWHSFLKRAAGNNAGLGQRRLYQSAVDIDPVRWALTAVVQSPDLPHLVTIGDEVVSLTWPKDVIRQSAEDFLADGLQHAISVQHDESLQDGVVSMSDPNHGVILQSFVNSWGCLDMNARHIPAGSWIVVYRAESHALRQAILDGSVSAVSLATTDFTLVDEED